MIKYKIDGIDIPIYKANPKILGKRTIGFTFGRIWMRDPENCSVENIRHEYIHILQQKELGLLVFIILYYLSWIWKVITFTKKPYYNIIFEKEAYKYADSENYLINRKKYNWFKNK